MTFRPRLITKGLCSSIGCKGVVHATECAIAMTALGHLPQQKLMMHTAAIASGCALHGKAALFNTYQTAAPATEKYPVACVCGVGNGSATRAIQQTEVGNHTKHEEIKHIPMSPVKPVPVKPKPALAKAKPAPAKAALMNAKHTNMHQAKVVHPHEDAEVKTKKILEQQVKRTQQQLANAHARGKELNTKQGTLRKSN